MRPVALMEEWTRACLSRNRLVESVFVNRMSSSMRSSSSV